MIAGFEAKGGRRRPKRQAGAHGARTRAEATRAVYGRVCVPLSSPASQVRPVQWCVSSYASFFEPTKTPVLGSPWRLWTFAELNAWTGWHCLDRV